METAIIGGGAAAVGMLDALAATAEEPGGITVFEPSPHLWRGRPYGPDMDSVLVNSPPAIMSIRHRDYGHYSSWLGERGADHLDERLREPLVPRALYGEYLEHTAETALAALRETGWSVRILAARVTRAARTGTRMTLGTEDGQGIEADRVALCVGGRTPLDHYGLDGALGFRRRPVPAAAHPRSDPVRQRRRRHRERPDRGRRGRGARGAGAHRTDHVVVAQWCAAPRLAAPGRPSTAARDRRTGGGVGTGTRWVTFDDLTGLLRGELAEAGEDFEEFTAELLATETADPVRRLRAQLDAVGDARIGRRFLQQAAHTVGPYVWPLLPESDRIRLRRYFRVASSVASPMVPVNASVLMRLFDSGQLALAAGVHGIEAADGRFRVRYGYRGHTVGHVVNAVNPTPQAIPRAADQLVGSLLADGSAVLYPSGGLIPADPRLHIVGDLAGVGSFITSSIPGIAYRSTRVAQEVLAP